MTFRAHNFIYVSVTRHKLVAHMSRRASRVLACNIFKEFGEYAKHINFGGKIYNSEPGGIHTSTQMGSGHFSSEGYGRTCFIRNISTPTKMEPF